jgi:peroxiredoxin
MVKRLDVPFEVLSDEHFALTNALRLPTFTVEGMTLMKRLTLVIRGGRIEHVFYPVFPPDKHAEEVIAWLTAHPIGA